MDSWCYIFTLMLNSFLTSTRTDKNLSQTLCDFRLTWNTQFESLNCVLSRVHNIRTNRNRFFLLRELLFPLLCYEWVGSERWNGLFFTKPRWELSIWDIETRYFPRLWLINFTRRWAPISFRKINKPINYWVGNNVISLFSVWKSWKKTKWLCCHPNINFPNFIIDETITGGFDWEIQGEKIA